MFTTNNHYQLHMARQSELEAEARNQHISSMLMDKKNGDVFRKRIGEALISFGEKLAQEPKREAQLAFSVQQ